jgi:hypothetical protein
MRIRLARAKGREIGDRRRADSGLAAAAILEKEQRNFAEAVEIGAVDYEAAPPLAADETGARQAGPTHRVLGNADEPGQLPRGNPLQLAADQQPEGVEARDLRQR